MVFWSSEGEPWSHLAGVFCGPAAPVPPGSCLEMQSPRPAALGLPTLLGAQLLVQGQALGESSWRSSSCRCAGLLAAGTGEGVAAGEPFSASPPPAVSAPGPAGGLQGQHAASRAVKWAESKAPRTRPHCHPVGTQAHAGTSPVMHHPTEDSVHVRGGGCLREGPMAVSIQPQPARGSWAPWDTSQKGARPAVRARPCGGSARLPAGPRDPWVPALGTTVCLQMSVTQGTS